MKFVDIHTHSTETSKEQLTIINKFPEEEPGEGYFSVGWHPWYIEADKEAVMLQKLETLAMHPNCLAIGECGLDKVTDTNFALQMSMFKKQVAISEKLQKPIVIHCVKAYQEIYQLKKELNPSQVWVIHGYHKNEQLASQLLSVGFQLSFGAALCENSTVQRTFANLPEKTFFLETDDQSEVSIEKVYEEAAYRRNRSVTELQSEIFKNFKEVFKV
ncbi:TatD family hydrolase [Neptunitalea lumnitzerae]|uniref:TatD family hydrolase n=1 Tax=Neptunitalea lumnitzerae TaxID=2965509 RepID=A0ABQ5MI39_9FLAO|nr:TatD family hydrolase [Neptunitalea sp. Y10]GLB49063.1 TatD family hydrolase [Neptunitalea sp. Y10]